MRPRCAWELPTKLFGHFKSVGFCTFGIVRPQIDVHKSPTVLVADFATETIHIIVIAFDRDGPRPVNGRADDFSLFQTVGNKHIAIYPSLGGVSGHRLG